MAGVRDNAYGGGELALSEAAALYSGTGADQVFYLDSAYSMSQVRELSRDRT